MSRRLLFWLMPAFTLTLLLSLLLSHPLQAQRPTAAPGDVIISEVAWSGTAASSSDEWMELYNTTNQAIDLTGWTIEDGLSIILSGQIEANSFFLLERTDDTTISNLAADQIYTGALTDGGETLILRDAGSSVIDTANGDGDVWPAGTLPPDRHSMERLDPDVSDSDANWVSNDGITRNGLDANGNAINGTPRQPNSSWSITPPAGEPDLVASKSGPAIAAPGSNITYQIGLQNAGSATANGVTLTDTLPIGLSYLSDDGGFPLSQPDAQTLVWSIGEVLTPTNITFHVNVAVAANASGSVTNQIVAATSSAESNLGNNQAGATTVISDGTTPVVLIEAILYDGYVSGDLDEAV